jgi:hypothetical protein
MLNKLFKLGFLPIKTLIHLNFLIIKLFTNYYIRRTFIINENSYKSLLIKNIAKFYNYHYFIETGTHLGNTSYKLRKIFKKIQTTELDKINFLKSKARLSKFNHIQIYNLDSKLFLKKIIPSIKKSIFFLDAHYSGPTTAKSKDSLCFNELREINKSKIKNHLIIIDDISDFSPKTFTLSKILSLIEKININYKFYFEYNMLFAIPQNKKDNEFFRKIIPPYIVR